MILSVECELEEDGRWIAEVVDLPGALAYGATSDEAIASAKALALCAVGERLEYSEPGPDPAHITFVTL